MNPNHHEFRVVLGITDLRAADAAGSGSVVRSINLDTVKIPAKFNKASWIYDYALWQLSSPITSQDHITPVPLAGPSDPSLYADNAPTVALGWADPQGTGTRFMHAINEYIDLANTSHLTKALQATEFYTRPYILKPEGSAPGDSGGPVLAQKADGTLVQIGLLTGITSRSKATAIATDPSFADIVTRTNPGPGQDWIVKNAGIPTPQ
jgi:hypothetical protein